MTILTYKNRLLQSALMGYISAAPHKTGVGILNPPNKIAHNRASGFFTCKASSRLFRIMAGRMGPLSGGPVSILSGVENPVRLATLEILNSGGELPFIKIGAPSWQAANNAARRLRVSIPRQKSTAVCSAPDKYPQSCVSICCLTTHTPSLRYTLRPYSAIWRTICGTLKNWWERQENSSPENLTQKQHSAFWWSVCLHDIQEAP